MHGCMEWASSPPSLHSHEYTDQWAIFLPISGKLAKLPAAGDRKFIRFTPINSSVKFNFCAKILVTGCRLYHTFQIWKHFKSESSNSKFWKIQKRNWETGTGSPSGFGPVAAYKSLAAPAHDAAVSHTVSCTQALFFLINCLEDMDSQRLLLFFLSPLVSVRLDWSTYQCCKQAQRLAAVSWPDRHCLCIYLGAS